MYRRFRLTTRACVLDFQDLPLHAGSAPELTQGLVSAAILSTDWPHDRFALGRTLAVGDPKLVDTALLATLTEQRHARVHTCGTPADRNSEQNAV
jgi:hypothetical protein